MSSTDFSRTSTTDGALLASLGKPVKDLQTIIGLAASILLMTDGRISSTRS